MDEPPIGFDLIIKAFLPSLVGTLVCSDVFNYLQQDVHRHTELDPAELTAHDCRLRSQASTTLMNQLQDLRKVTEELTPLFDMTVCEARTYYHNRLLNRLEKNVKRKIRKLLNNVLYKESMIDIYNYELTFRQNVLKFAKRE
ncbi:hypothetical protein CEXT_69451 [Caerostris extrusa]|uniref:Uncharacterized protein n=1 Tax=Caerostris extrusa TaxID=172846 RepID=A0AAV4R7B8_CAEEX|nr:hypothetical protein CEXT_69451 [Caerostris extrusa]